MWAVSNCDRFAEMQAARRKRYVTRFRCRGLKTATYALPIYRKVARVRNAGAFAVMDPSTKRFPTMDNIGRVTLEKV